MISSVFRKLAQTAWVLPGFLLWASFPPMGEKVDVLFALAPLLWLSRRGDARSSAWRWFCNGMFFWVATLAWMPAIVKNGGPWPLVVLGWMGLAAYCSAFFAAFGYLSAKTWKWARQGNYCRRLACVLFVEPVLWCGLELIRSRFLGGFAWNQLGVVAVNGGFGAPASWGGIYLCSAVVILINGTIAGIAERVWRPELSGFPQLRKFGMLETVLVFAGVFGLYRLTEPSQIMPEQQTSQPTVKVALVQRNFPCVFKRQAELPLEAYGRLLGTVSHLQPDIVVMAESAMCEFGPIDQQGATRFAEWVSRHCGGAAVLAGGTRYGDDREYNSAALYSFADGRKSCFASNAVHNVSLDVYDKVHLVPFGEFIPGDKWITSLQKLAPVGSCTPGDLKLLRLPLAQNGDGTTLSVNAGVAICFEDTDSAQIRRLAKMGARILFFITNDSWFSKSNETMQHAWQAVARAIETGLPVVRVGNSGVSGTVSPDGRATWLIGSNGKPLVDHGGSMFDRIPVQSMDGSVKMTVYVKLGDVPLAIAFALLILSIIMIKYKEHYEKRRSMSL